MQNKESELVMLAKKHDEKAMAELYEMTYGRIYASVRRVLHNDTDAQDVLQDAYISAFRHIESLKDTEKFNPWLYRIAINLCKNFLKKRKPALFTDLEGEDGGVVEFADERETFNPERQADLSDTINIFDKIFDSLPEDQRLCIVMYYRDELSVAEISDILGISQNTVKSRLSYGRKKIQAEVEGMEKKGIKLYSAMPFLTWMLGKEMADTSVAADIPAVSGMLTAVHAAEGVGATGAAVTGTVQAVSMQTAGAVAGYTLKAGTVFAKVVVGKLTVGAVAAITAGVVIVGGVTGNIVSNINSSDTIPVVVDVVQTTVDSRDLSDIVLPEAESGGIPVFDEELNTSEGDDLAEAKGLPVCDEPLETQGETDTHAISVEVKRDINSMSEEELIALLGSGEELTDEEILAIKTRLTEMDSWAIAKAPKPVETQSEKEEPKQDAYGYIYTKEEAVKIFSDEYRKLIAAESAHYIGPLEEAKNLPDFTQESFDNDLNQMLTKPYSSQVLSPFFEEFRMGSSLAYLLGNCEEWLASGGDDGK